MWHARLIEDAVRGGAALGRVLEDKHRGNVRKRWQWAVDRQHGLEPSSRRTSLRTFAPIARRQCSKRLEEKEGRRVCGPARDGYLISWNKYILR